METNMGTDASSHDSIKRADSLLKLSTDEKDFIILKLLPEPRGCCCFHCWPMTWAMINNFISPDGSIPDEGDALIHSSAGDYVLECHESGPEIVVYLGVATASLLLIKSVVDLITTFLKALGKEHRKKTSRIKLTHRSIRGGQVTDDILIEIDLPLAGDTTELLNAKVKEILEKNTEPIASVDSGQKPVRID
jgi:hypothetical protein